MGKHDSILKETFSINDKSHTVWLFTHQLTWCPQKSGGEDMSEWMSVKIEDIFSVEIEDGFQASSNCCLPTTTSAASPPSQNIMVYYAQRKKNSDIWECEGVKLGHTDSNVMNSWTSTIQSALNDLKHRPKNLLVLLNPFGGKRRGKNIFQDCIKPILELGGVTWTLINTQYQNHASEILISMSQDKLLEYDVVVAVGGDGTACEVVTGLLRRSLETSASNQDTILQPSQLKIAVIPAGSSNALAYSVHGTADPCTAVIHLVLGGSVPLDVGALHDSHSGVERFFVTQVSYGHLADTLKKSDKLRWMGPRRYDYAGLCKFLNHKAYEGTLEVRGGEDVRKTPSECGAGNTCEDCSSSRGFLSNKTEPTQNEWKKVEGCFLNISVANISCRCTLSPRGMAPFAHISDGHFEVVVVRKASRLNHLQYLLRTAGDSRTVFQLPFVERYRAKELIFTPVACCAPAENTNEIGILGSSSSVLACGCDARQQKKSHSYWNCDGELFRQPAVRVTVHSNLIRIMARAAIGTDSPQISPAPLQMIPPNMEPLPIDIPIN